MQADSQSSYEAIKHPYSSVLSVGKIGKNDVKEDKQTLPQSDAK